jgi:hypothetical protein
MEIKREFNDLAHPWRYPGRGRVKAYVVGRVDPDLLVVVRRHPLDIHGPPDYVGLRLHQDYMEVLSLNHLKGMRRLRTALPLTACTLSNLRAAINLQ